MKSPKQLDTKMEKTRRSFLERLEGIVFGRKKIDEEMLEELEEALIQADVGVATSLKLVDALREKAQKEKAEDASKVRRLLEEEISGILKEGDHLLNLAESSLQVIMMVGVNGAGKTTSIGKLSHRLKQEGRKVLVAAGDTFRAGAAEQLEVWCRRAGVDIVRHQEGSDPAAVVYDALQAARARNVDVLLVDTAGRLQTKTNLMEELKKVRRIIQREIPEGPAEVLLTLDATTGQNALSQAKLFTEAVGVTGVILTKLDGTAKGGVVLGIQDEYKLPVKFIGVGEGLEDLEEFDPAVFCKALLG